MKCTRLWWLELSAVLGPEIVLPILALCLITALHASSPALGPESWRSLFVENVASYLPIAFALALVPIGLRDADQRTLEEAITLRPTKVLAMRFALLFGGLAVLSVAWLGILALFWGPVPFAMGLFAGLGPALLLSSVAALAAALTGRASVGYLLAIGWPLADLVLRLLGALAGPLQLIDVFAYRWPVPALSWQSVGTAQGIVGAVLWLLFVFGGRRLLRRLL